ncbi:YfiR family protein [Daejeonella lutea]|uniref:DUF4154 domain-containing protein n=1 Tax=Daejeonella lutea TaxID=572036 RepID=A0A1T5BX03_9SPHI|nr:YfiR family protein [Daejeonella lutea]SKB51671.1 protein of unknown function [Daejeonella lutea]
MRIKQFIFIFLTSILVLSNYAFQVRQPQGQEYNLKAAFLYRFLDYVEWNNNSSWNNTTEDPLRIAILGESGLYGPLMEISRDKKAGTRTIRVRQINSVSEIGSSQVIFVSRNYKYGIDAVLNRMLDKPALIISEQKGDVEKGSHINFLIADNKLKFEVNLKTAARSGIKIGSQLLQHATLIKK